MKHFNSKSIGIFSITTIVLFTCWNGSMVDSNSKEKRSDVNFYGNLNDEAVEDILISGKYNEIPVYKLIASEKKSSSKDSVDQSKSSMAEKSPTSDQTKLNLDDIANITLKYLETPTAKEIEINTKKYVVINVTLINGSVHEYMIEAERPINALAIDKGPSNNQPILNKRIIKMSALKNLTIKGRKAAQDINQSRMREEMQNTDKITLTQNIEKDLDQIQQEVDNLPQHDPSQYEKFKISIVKLLRSLRDQLQKMLHMIKN
ncbi:hypothetical protein KBB68_02230 [Candidatus Babeliales bacterium]|nr:hypothetical protein [Candidatus Babeliales bacterium]